MCRPFDPPLDSNPLAWVARQRAPSSAVGLHRLRWFYFRRTAFRLKLLCPGQLRVWQGGGVCVRGNPLYSVFAQRGAAPDCLGSRYSRHLSAPNSDLEGSDLRFHSRSGRSRRRIDFPTTDALAAARWPPLFPKAPSSFSMALNDRQSRRCAGNSGERR